MKNGSSVIIVNYSTRDLLRDCLASLGECSTENIEIIVVDNHSSDGSTAMVREEFPEVVLIENSGNLGFAKANNQGIKQASCKYLLLLNSDTVVRPGAIEAMAEYMDTHADAGGVACRLVYADGRIQASVGRQAGPGITRQIFRLSGLSRVIAGDRARQLLRRYLGFAIGRTLRSYLDPYVADSVLEVESISGACLMLRREATDQIGLLDENFFMYLEDLDYCTRLRKAGWKLYYVPAGEIVHLVGQSSGGRMRQYSIHSYKSLFYFYQKHYSAGTLLAMRVVVFLTMCFHWAWNFVRGVFSCTPVYKTNRSDLGKVIRLSLQWRAAQGSTSHAESLPGRVGPSDTGRRNQEA